MGEPVRTCVGCGQKGPRSTRVRLVSDGDGGLRIGRSLPGRGAWLCVETLESCFDQGVKRRAFARSLRTAVSRPGPLKQLVAEADGPIQ